MARLRRRPEEVGERGEADAGHPPGEQAPREPHRVDDAAPPAAARSRRSTSRSRKARSKRALCATSTAARRRRRGSGAPPRPRAAPRGASAVGDAREPRDHGRERRRRVDERLERPRRQQSLATRTAPISQIADCAGRRPVVSRSTTTNVRELERQVARRAAPPARRTPRATPAARRRRRRPRAGSARAPSGALREREERARRLLDGHRPAPFLDQLDQPVGGVEARAAPLREYTNICSLLPLAASRPRAARAALG